MENGKYVFKLSPYDTTYFLPQVSAALEKRTESVSRERFPGLWEKTDKLNERSKGEKKNTTGTKIKSIICLLLGIFLFVPGMMEPQELLIPLLVGAVAIGAGIGGLWRSRKNRKNPFDKSAARLLQGKDTISAENPVVVIFSEEGMMLPADSEEAELVPYGNFERVIEAQDIFLFVFGERVMVLQKGDLTDSDVSGFSEFIARKVAKYQSLIKNPPT